MRCHHFDAGECRSCTLLPIPRDRQIRSGRERIEQLLAPYVAPRAGGGPADAAPSAVWSPPISGAESGFRSRARMAVSGTAQHPVLGLPGQAEGADLSDCPLYPEGVEQVLRAATALIRRAQVPPYDVAKRRGEIKNVLVTASPEGEHALRLVLRSQRALPRIREHLPRLLEQDPSVVMVTANIHPEHTTRLEGPEEIHLAGAASLPLRTGDVTLRARPQSFLQTNTEVAGELYRQGAAWARDIAAERTAAQHDADPLRVWDLYCGLGGFALHLARALPGAEVTGVEVSAQAIDGAREAAQDLAAAGPGRGSGPAGAAAQDPATPDAATIATSGTSVPPRFLAADATAWAIEQAAGPVGSPDLVVVNPPRRGIGPELAEWLEASGVRDVLYSSCNPATLATDLARMPSLEIRAGRYVDMFPHTEHAEVIVRLQRR